MLGYSNIKMIQVGIMTVKLFINFSVLLFAMHVHKNIIKTLSISSPRLEQCHINVACNQVTWTKCPLIQ